MIARSRRVSNDPHNFKVTGLTVEQAGSPDLGTRTTKVMPRYRQPGFGGSQGTGWKSFRIELTTALIHSTTGMIGPISGGDLLVRDLHETSKVSHIWSPPLHLWSAPSKVQSLLVCDGDIELECARGSGGNYSDSVCINVSQQDPVGLSFIYA